MRTRNGERINEDETKALFSICYVNDISRKDMATIADVSPRVVRHWREGDYQPTREQCEKIYTCIARGEASAAKRKTGKAERKQSYPKTVSFVPNEGDEMDLQWLMRLDGTTNKSEILRDALHEYIENRIDRIRKLESEYRNMGEEDE